MFVRLAAADAAVVKRERAILDIDAAAAMISLPVLHDQTVNHDSAAITDMERRAVVRFAEVGAVYFEGIAIAVNCKNISNIPGR